MKKWIHAAVDTKFNKQEFSNRVKQIVDTYLPDNHKLDTLSINWEDSYQHIYIENSAPLLTAHLELTPFLKSSDVQGAATKIINYLNQCIESDKLVFSEDYVEFLNKYRSYFDKIDRAVREVASKYDSDMSFDFDLLIEDKYEVKTLVERMIQYGEVDFSGYNVSISRALGLDAIDPKPRGIPSEYTDGNIVVHGPLGIYYNGVSPDPELKYFDADLKRLKVAVRDYFEHLKYNLENGTLYGDESRKRYDDDYPERAEERAQRDAEPKKSRTSSRRKWSSVVSQLSRDLEEVDDPLYEQTDVGEYIESICGEVESALNYYVEPSIQAGQGGVWIYDEANDNELVVEDYDFETFDSDIIDMALNSKNMTEFKSNYKNYLLSLGE